MKYQILEYTPHDGTDAWTTLYDSGNFYSDESAYTLPTHYWDGYNLDVTIDPWSIAPPYGHGSATIRISIAASSHDYKIYHTKIFDATQKGTYPSKIEITTDGWTGGDRASASPIALPKNLGTYTSWVQTSAGSDYTNSVAAIFVVRNPVTHTHWPLFDPATGLLIRGASQILRDE